MKLRWIMVYSFLLTGGTGFAYGQTPVEISRSVVKDLADHLNLVGTVYPELASTVSAEMAGRVERVRVSEGDRVRKGDALAELDRRMIEVRLEQTRARLKQAEDEYERIQKLAEKDLASPERAQRIETELALRKTELRMAEIALENSTIRAPFAGLVAWKHVEVGEWISAGGKVANVIKSDRVHVVTSVPETHIKTIHPGLLAGITCDAYEGERFSGTVITIIPQADNNSHAFPVKIEVDNADGRLKAGMFARVDLPVSRSERVVMVPKDAVVMSAGGEHVFELDGDKVKRIQIETGRTEGDYVVVTGGLSTAVPLVVTGNEGLSDGAEVKVVGEY